MSFRRDPKVGRRQEYCSEEACQRLRKARYQRRFREKRGSEETARRLVQRIADAKDRIPAASPRPRPREPLGKIPWDDVTSLVGVDQAFVLELGLRVIVSWLARSSRVHGASEDAHA